MSRRKFKHLSIDDLLPGRSEDTHRIDVDKNGKPKVIRNKKRKTAPLPYFKQYPTFFRLINGNPGIPEPIEEYKFHPKRRWRVDICWPDQKLALEIEGGTFMKSGGGHRSVTGYHKDMEKYNAMSIQGYFLLRFTTREMESCESYDVLREWFKNNGSKSEKT